MQRVIYVHHRWSPMDMNSPPQSSASGTVCVHTQMVPLKPLQWGNACVFICACMVPLNHSSGRTVYVHARMVHSSGGRGYPSFSPPTRRGHMQVDTGSVPTGTSRLQLQQCSLFKVNNTEIYTALKKND